MDAVAAASAEHLKVVKGALDRNGDGIHRACKEIIESLGNNGKALICGNGGSAADAQHFAAELVGKYKMERKGLAAVALSTDTSVLTSLANDYGYERVFARQVEALGKEGDVLVAISTSGNSKNVVLAIEEAKRIGMKIIGFSGKGGKMEGMCDVLLSVDCENTPRVQEAHIVMIHIICEIVEKGLAGK